MNNSDQTLKQINVDLKDGKSFEQISENAKAENIKDDLNMDIWDQSRNTAIKLSPVLQIQQMQLSLDRDLVDLMFCMPDVLIGSEHNFTHMQILMIMMIGDVVRSKAKRNKRYNDLSSITHHRSIDIEAGRPVVKHEIDVDVWETTLKVLKSNDVIKDIRVDKTSSKEYYPVRQFNQVVKKQFIYPTLQQNCPELFHYVIKNNVDILIGADGNLYISKAIMQISDWELLVKPSVDNLLKGDDDFYLIADRVKLGFIDC